jgi:glucokinase
LNVFVSVLGAQAGNLALTVMATGGVFLGGGIPPRILPFLERGCFMEAFERKGRFSELLGRVPVYVILNPKVALVGAARYGLETYEDDLVDQPTKGS